jgi:hypothetical protein
MSPTDLANAVLAIGSLGTASFALVDATKAFGGGISNRGFGLISHMLARFIPSQTAAFHAVRGTLQGNWINGAASLNDQRSIAKTLIKVHLTTDTAPEMANQAGVNRDLLGQVAQKYSNASASPALTAAEQDVASRFDLQLSSIIDEAYQRADQRYRNSAKFLAIVFAILLAIAGKLALGATTVGWGEALVAGLLAAPLAPISKDLASALQASVKALQVIKG